MGGSSDLPQDWGAKPCILRSYRRSKQIWTKVHGPPPPGLMVLHRCHQNHCWEVTHFYLGTKSDNTKDAYANGYKSPSLRPEVRAKISATLKGRKIGPRKSPGPMPCSNARRQAIIEGKQRAKERTNA